MNYIGMDTSIASLDFAVSDEKGNIKKKKKIDTSENGLIEFLRTIPKPRTLYCEEGSLASWIVEVCYRHGEKVIIMDPKRNRWISKDEQKTDSIDAIKIAELARGKFYKEISHAVGHRKRFRELMLYYHDTIRMKTRIKNIIKAKFRQYGINCLGKTVFIEKYQEEWLKKLKDNPQQKFIIEQLFKQLEIYQNQIDELLNKIKTQCKTYAEIKHFRDLPGIDWINAATISALLENPHRFATKKKIWTYAGIGVSKKTSAKIIYQEKSNQNYNRLLKYTLYQAVQVAISSNDNYFRRKYIYLTLNGKTPRRAFLQICRNYLTIIWTIWRTGNPYREKLFEIKKNA